MNLLSIIVALAAICILSLIAVLAIAIAAWRRMKRRNSVGQKSISPSPLKWMFSPQKAAQLHRRLKAATAVARSSAVHPGAPTNLASLAASIESEAQNLDHQLTIAAKLRGLDAKQRVQAIAAQVNHLETLASQLSLQSAQSTAAVLARDSGSALEEIGDQLKAMDAATSEVRQAEAQAGLTRVSPFGGSTG